VNLDVRDLTALFGNLTIDARLTATIDQKKPCDHDRDKPSHPQPLFGLDSYQMALPPVPFALIVHEPSRPPTTLEFESKDVRIGTDEDADVQLRHKSVSTELNARIRQQEGELMLTSYCGAAPVRVNGQVANLRALVDKDVLKIGDVEIIVVAKHKIDPREQPLVDDILNNPTDETLRVVYADWLEENGFQDRAEYLRLDAEIYMALKGAWKLKIREDIATLSGLARHLPPAWIALMRRKKSSF